MVKKNNSVIGRYTYDSDGMRITKTTAEGPTTYHVMNGVCYGETRSNGQNLQYVFDENGRVIGFRMQFDTGSIRFYFVFNAQGDVVQLLDSWGNVQANYSYDTWGRCTATDSNGNALSSDSIGMINPFRYRGYYYDNETGLYYLQSRYYDPVVGRFLNADDTDYLGADGSFLSYNLFAYCANNPVNRVDANGHWSGWATAGIIVGAALCIAAVTVLTCGIGTATLAGAVAVGAAKGALIGVAIGTAAGGGIGYAATGTLEGTLTGAAIGFGAGSVVGAVAGGTSAGLQYGTFSSKTSLMEHFTKHGDEFGNMYSNAREYAEGARYVIKNGTYIPEKNAYIRFLGNQGKANYAFVGLKSGGRISTYHVRSVGKMIKDAIALFM